MNEAVLWGAFVAGILGLVALDLGISRGRHEVMPVSRALVWSALWIALSLGFGLVVWKLMGSRAAVEFYTGWLLEKSLSIDNLFVFLLIFAHLRVPAEEQHRVLTWGILGALVLRGVMIGVGLELIRRSHAVLYVFGAFLVVTGLRTLWKGEARDEALAEQKTVRLARRLLPIAPRYEGGRFFTRENGKRVGTLLLLALLTVELSDVVFAIDSIPAIFAVTQDPFVVFSSNMLAILGLRALFFALAGLLTRLRFLHYGLGAILILVGAKMCLTDVVRVPPVASLLVTLTILAVTVLASLYRGGRARIVEEMR